MINNSTRTARHGATVEFLTENRNRDRENALYAALAQPWEPGQ